MVLPTAAAAECLGYHFAQCCLTAHLYKQNLVVIHMHIRILHSNRAEIAINIPWGGRWSG